METKSGHAQRSARMRQVFGSDDPEVVMSGLRERRAAVVVALLRRAFAAIAPGRARRAGRDRARASFARAE